MFGGLIHVFLVVGDDGLGNGLTDSVELGCATASLYSDAHVNIGEAGKAKEEEGFQNLGAKSGGLNELDGLSVHLDKATAALAVCDGDGGFLAPKDLVS